MLSRWGLGWPRYSVAEEQKKVIERWRKRRQHMVRKACQRCNTSCFPSSLENRGSRSSRVGQFYHHRSHLVEGFEASMRSRHWQLDELGKRFDWSLGRLSSRFHDCGGLGMARFSIALCGIVWRAAWNVLPLSVSREPLGPDPGGSLAGPEQEKLSCITYPKRAKTHRENVKRTITALYAMTLRHTIRVRPHQLCSLAAGTQSSCRLSPYP